MGKTPPRPSPQDEAQIDAEINEGGPTRPERMTEPARRTAQVPKPEVPMKAKSRKTRGR